MSKVKTMVIMALVVTVIVAMSVLPSCKDTSAETTTVAETTTAGTMKPEDIKIGFVIHVPCAYTDGVKRGAEAAAKDYGVQIEFAAPPGYDQMQQIQLFESIVNKGVTAMVTLAADPKIWEVPINAAVDSGIIVYTAVHESDKSKASGHFGNSGYFEGVELAKTLLGMPEVQALNGKGKIVLGNCDPQCPILIGRINGLKEIFETDSPDWEIIGAFDSGMSQELAYNFWESQYTANPDMVMGVGHCAFDIPAMSIFKDKTPDAKFISIGYSLEPETLEALKDGKALVSSGHHPFLEGYLPIMAICEHLINGNPLTQGAVYVGVELITQKDAEDILVRETDRAVEYDWYKDFIAKNFTPIWDKVVVPMEKWNTLGPSAE